MKNLSKLFLSIRKKHFLAVISIFSISFIILLNSKERQNTNSNINFKLTDVNYEIIGNGTPILMIHGMSVDHRVMKNAFEPIFNDVPEKWKRIYLDLPGMGKTKAFDWINNSDDMLLFLNEFVNKVMPNEEFIIAGYSYGGYLARGLLHTKMEKIKAAIFICPLIFPNDKERNIPENIFYIKDYEAINNTDYLTKSLIDYFLVNQTTENIIRLNSDIVSGNIIVNRTFVDRIRNNPQRYSFTNKLLKSFECFEKKTIFITAKQDILVGYKDAQNILNYFPNNTFILIDSAGHAVQIEKQKQFESHMRHFLNEM